MTLLFQVFIKLRDSMQRVSITGIPAGIRIVFAVLSAIIAVQYFNTKIYDLPSAQEFYGDHWYNPYEKLNREWLKANFHAHSTSWAGITNGHQPGDEVVKAYMANQYDVASLSDYHRINDATYSPGNIAIPVFEHGMNITKAHHLAIGATEVVYDNVMLWQTTHMKQSMIDRLNDVSSIVCINHPGMKRCHSYESISKLTGYQLLEVLNGHRKYFDYWDSVLTAGRPVWILGNDDCHDIEREKFSFAWNIVNATGRTEADVIEALRSGRSIAVRRNHMFKNADSLTAWCANNDGNILKSIDVRGNAMTFRFQSNIKRIKLIGPHGRVLLEHTNTDSIRYSPGNETSYVRAEIETDELSVYLNPIIRYDGENIPANTRLATVEFLPTLILRLSIVISYLFILTVLFPQTIRFVLYGHAPKQILYEK